jgi:antitoxin component of MazEF toxin-antitoxin module
MKVGRRGNGLWVRIPAAIVRNLNIRPGDEAELIAIGEHSFEIRCVHIRRDGVDTAIQSSRLTPED